VMSHHMVTMRPKNSIIERVAGSLVAGIIAPLAEWHSVAHWGGLV
jgi:hypothetical protein